MVYSDQWRESIPSSICARPERSCIEVERHTPSEFTAQISLHNLHYSYALSTNLTRPQTVMVREKIISYLTFTIFRVIHILKEILLFQ